jgi:hypothetical protein
MYVVGHGERQSVRGNIAGYERKLAWYGGGGIKGSILGLEEVLRSTGEIKSSVGKCS